MRRGFTLVEVLVALVLVQFGLMAVAASSALAARDIAIAARAAHARDAARERIERLRPSACSATLEGADSSTALTEYWSIRGDSIARRLRDSVAYHLPAGRRGHIVLEQMVLC